MVTRFHPPTLGRRRLNIKSELREMGKLVPSGLHPAEHGPKRALTKEEYEARRLLLGFDLYDDITNTFWKTSPLGAEAAMEFEVDADTMEPVNREERNRRFLEYGKKYGFTSGSFSEQMSNEDIADMLPTKGYPTK